MPGPYPNQPQTYQYQTNDNPTSLAQQFGVTPSQLLNANPGGYPFSTGQTIKIPQYSSPIGPTQPPGYQGLTPSQAQPKPTQAQSSPYFQLAAPNNPVVNNMSQQSQNAWTQRMNAQTTAVITNQIANGIQPPMIPANTSITNPVTGKPATPDDLIASGYAFNPKTNSWNLAGSVQNPGQTASAPAGNSAFMNTGFMQQYAAQGTAFENQKRWDESTGKFVRIGDLIRQGKLDLKTGKTTAKGKRGGGGGGGGGQAQPVLQEAKNSNVNSVLSFNLGSG